MVKVSKTVHRVHFWRFFNQNCFESYPYFYLNSQVIYSWEIYDFEKHEFLYSFYAIHCSSNIHFRQLVRLWQIPFLFRPLLVNFENISDVYLSSYTLLRTFSSPFSHGRPEHLNIRAYYNLLWLSGISSNGGFIDASMLW